MRVNGWRMHYVDVGDPILLLHGNPTWGFLYRDVIPPLVRSGRRVIVPDMIGFRLSEKPVREYAHSLNGHIANLTGLVRQLDLQRLTVVCHDWGGPTGLGFAMSDPERIRALSVMTTWPGRRRRPSSVPAYSPGASCMLLLGPYLLGGRHNVLARRGVYLSVVGRDKFRREAQVVYDAVLPDAEARLLTWVWPRWIPLDDTTRAQAHFARLEAELAKSKLPTLIIWGREDEGLRASDGLPQSHHLCIQLERGAVDRLVTEATHQARRLVEDQSRLAVRVLVDGETHRHVEARFDVMLDHGDGDQGIADRVQDKARRASLFGYPFAMIDRLKPREAARSQNLSNPALEVRLITRSRWNGCPAHLLQRADLLLKGAYDRIVGTICDEGDMLYSYLLDHDFFHYVRIGVLLSSVCRQFGTHRKRRDFQRSRATSSAMRRAPYRRRSAEPFMRFGPITTPPSHDALSCWR